MEPEHAADRDAKDRDDHDKDEKKPPKDSIWRRPAVIVAATVVLLVAIGGGIAWWLHARHFEDTDDAFIDTHIVRLSAQTAGQVLRVLVSDNQRVEAGQPLVEIDPAETTAHLDQAMAQVAQAETQLREAQAQVEVQQAAHQEAASDETGTTAQATSAERDFARFKALQASMPEAVAEQQLDQAQATAHNASAQREAARQKVEGAAAQIGAAEAQVVAAEAQVKMAEAQMHLARIALSYTHMTAPVAGFVTQSTAAVGNYVTPGQQLLAIVPLQLWITANFKETQLADVRVGQEVEVKVDACPDAKISAHVDSIQRGAGQAFGLLPAENATGNFVKVVQRVPVKLILDSVPDDCPLGPGMSVTPRVRVR